jgi:hypothetical protein
MSVQHGVLIALSTLLLAASAQAHNGRDKGPPDPSDHGPVVVAVSPPDVARPSAQPDDGRHRPSTRSIDIGDTVDQPVPLK